MRPPGLSAILTTTVLALAVTVVDAQRHGPGPMGPAYDPATEVTLRGVVQEVRQIADWMGRRSITGTHLVLKTGEQTIEVHLGPSSFLATERLSFAVGDDIEVIGSRVQFSGVFVIVAREVHRGSDRLTLRDARGFPRWSRRGRW
jgi:hypothetical protein